MNGETRGHRGLSADAGFFGQAGEPSVYRGWNEPRPRTVPRQAVKELKEAGKGEAQQPGEERFSKLSG